MLFGGNELGSYLKELIELRKNFVNAYEKMKYAEALDCGNKIIDIYKKNNERKENNAKGN